MLTCPFHWITGWLCPFCGGQRMMIALLHGKVAEAFWLNPALFIALPLVSVWWFRKRSISLRAAMVMLCLACVWALVRNIFPIG